jgi:hypothetical protein
MGVNDTIKVSGGTFTDDLSITTASGTQTQGNVVGEKNKTILSGDLTIMDGELFSLTNFKITGNTYVNNNTIILPDDLLNILPPAFKPITQSFTNCEFKLIEIRGGDITLTFTDCKIKNNFRSLNASITGIINFIRCDFTGSSFNLLHSNKATIVMTDCIGLPDDVGLDSQNYIVKGITGYTTKLGAFLSHSYTANETPTLTNELTSKSYVDSQVGTKQDSINDGDLTIAKTAELQSALNNKQNQLTSGTNISIVDNEVSCLLSAGTNINITDGVISTTGLQNELTAGTNIDITDGVISSTGGNGNGGTTIDNTTDLNVKTLTSVGNINVGGVITAPNQILFKATRVGTDDTHNAREAVPYNGIVQDIGGGYSTTTYIYTVPVAGTYYFYANTFSTNGNENHVADLIVKRGTVEKVIGRIEKGFVGIKLNTYYMQSTYPCLVGDEVYVYNLYGTINLRQFAGDGITDAEMTNFGGFLIG